MNVEQTRPLAKERRVQRLPALLTPDSYKFIRLAQVVTALTSIAAAADPFPGTEADKYIALGAGVFFVLITYFKPKSEVKPIISESQIIVDDKNLTDKDMFDWLQGIDENTKIGDNVIELPLPDEVRQF